MKYLGIKKYKFRSWWSSSDYYDIPVKYCYVLFDPITGNIIALIDISNFNNSVCLSNELFLPTASIGDKHLRLPTDQTIIINILKHITPEEDLVKILKVDGDRVNLFETTTEKYAPEIVNLIKIKERDNIITNLIG